MYKIHSKFAGNSYSTKHTPCALKHLVLIFFMRLSDWEWGVGLGGGKGRKNIFLCNTAKMRHFKSLLYFSKGFTELQFTEENTGCDVYGLVICRIPM